MSKHLNNVLNNVVRDLFENGAGQYGEDLDPYGMNSGDPVVIKKTPTGGVDWNGNPVYVEDLPPEQQAYYRGGDLAPGDSEQYTESRPTSTWDNVKDTVGSIWNKGKELAGQAAEWDRNATKATNAAIDNFDKAGREATGRVATVLGNATNNPTLQKYGLENNPEASLGDKLRYMSNVGVQAVRDGAGQGFMDDLAKTGKDFAQSANEKVHQGARWLGKQTGIHGLEDWGAEGDPSMTWRDKAEKFFRQTGDNVSRAWNNASTAEKVAAGLVPTALAAGAGSLYLRKKQREANKAAGRK